MAPGAKAPSASSTARGGGFPSGIPTEIIKQMIEQQEEVKRKQKQFTTNMIILVVVYLTLQYVIPWVWDKYQLHQEKKKRLDELIEKNKKLQASLESARREFESPRGEAHPDKPGLGEEDSLQSSPLPRPLQPPRPKRTTTSPDSAPQKFKESPRPDSPSLPTPLPPPPASTLRRRVVPATTEATSNNSYSSSAASDSAQRPKPTQKRSEPLSTAPSPAPPSQPEPQPLAETRRIRAEQDLEYQHAARVQSERELEREMAAIEASELEQAARASREESFQAFWARIESLRQGLPVEPESEVSRGSSKSNTSIEGSGEEKDAASQGIVSLSFRFGGKRVNRRFASSTPVNAILDFIESCEDYLELHGLGNKGHADDEQSIDKVIALEARGSPSVTVAFPKLELTRGGGMTIGEILEGGTSAVIHVRNL